MWAAVQVAVSRLTVGPIYWTYVFADTWMFQLFTAAMTYTAAVGIGLSVLASDRERVRERHEAALELATREAELIALKVQLRPHFLLNALNSVLALVNQDAAQARVMVQRLADLLQAVFERLELHEVPLDREADMIRAYLDVERIRFGPRLTYEIAVAPAAGQQPVPPFLLQPIVENAVKHGIQPHARPGAIRLAATLDDGRLVITVRDTGTGFDEESPEGGRGLELTRRRLDELYGSNTRWASSGRAVGSSRGSTFPPMPPDPLRLLVADDEELARRLVRQYVSAHPDLVSWRNARKPTRWRPR